LNYRAFRTPEGIINVCDGECLLFALPPDFPLQFLRTICVAYEAGIENALAWTAANTTSV
jgi:hypothetical protein